MREFFQSRGVVYIYGMSSSRGFRNMQYVFFGCLVNNSSRTTVLFALVAMACVAAEHDERPGP